MATGDCVIGLDYGTDSVRALIVDAGDGKEVASCVVYYPRWREGKFCDPAKNQFRQHPLDYTESLIEAVKGALKDAPEGTAEKVKGLSFDTTGSTLVAVDEEGTPLSMKKGFEDNPNAMFVLWKDHTAVKEAGEINEVSRNWGGEDYTKYEGGIYSSEWFWAKILHVLREDEKVREAAFSWVEHCDWIPALLAGDTNPLKLKRGRCASGHKAMWHASWDGLPPEDYLEKIDPLLKGLRGKLFSETVTSDTKSGDLCKEWAEKLGLPEGIAVGVGAFDCHMGAVGAECEPYALIKVVGTSTCDILVAPNEEFKDKLVRGICGQVDGSVVPGMLGLEAGQSAFGDIYAWFKDLIVSGAGSVLDKKAIDELEEKLIPALNEKAEKEPIDESGAIALDWMNGRRTPDANQMLKGAILGLNMGSDAPKLFRALVEATAFGAKKIVDRFVDEGVPIKKVIAIGGIPKKSPFVMQVLADVLNMNILVAASEQACALGAAMFAATAAGIYKDVSEAQKAMGSGFEKEFKPIAENAKKYEKLYERYSAMAELVEGQIMKEA